MKKTLQTLLFALIAIMMPIGASAQETESGNDTEYGTTSDAEGAAVEVSTKTELIAALENGGNIMLTGDITVSDEYWGGYEITKNTTIDLNGHTITSVGVFSMFGHEENIVLTISGNGTVKNTNPNFTSAINGFGTLNLLGGTFEGGIDTFGTTIMSDGWVDQLNTDKHYSDEDTSSITGGYVGHLNCWGGILTISGGHVEALGIKYGTIIISGGTFGFDPTAYLAEGYTATEADGKWVVTCANGCEYTYSDNGDGTHTATCSVCGHKVTEEHSTEKDENKTNCQHGNICDICGVEYSEPDPDAHSYNEDGFCEMCSTANPDETMFFIFDGDHKAFNVAEDLVGVNIEYTRGLHNTEWNSLYLPFEVPVTEELLDEFEFAYVNDMHSADTDDNGEIDKIEMEIVKIKEGTLHANHPYFIRAKSEYTILQLSYENTTLHATKETTLNCSSIYMDYAIVGTYKHIKGTEFASMPADRYYAISIDGGWWQIPEDSSLYPFRAYLSMTARDGSPVKVSDEAMRSIRIREKGEGTTGIEEVKGENGEVKTIYDLQGRRVEVPNKGLYIINGKKVLIK